ncbi:MAG: hypothetical protein ACQEV7_21195 [Bacillota bacterium]
MAAWTVPVIGLTVGCSEETSEENGIGDMEIGIGRDEEMEVADVTDTFTVNDIIAVTYGQDEEPIGGRVLKKKVTTSFDSPAEANS